MDNLIGQSLIAINPINRNMKRQLRCKKCNNGILYPSKSDLCKHQKAEHGTTFGFTAHQKAAHVVSPKVDLKESTSSFDNIKQYEKMIHNELLKLDEERDKLQERILEIDNIIAKYKKI